MIHTSGKPFKVKRVLKALMEGRSFNRFDAEQQLEDKQTKKSPTGNQTDRG